MLIDTRIIHAHGRHAVTAHRQEVMWRDGSTLWLHHVQLDGLDAPLLRALQVDNCWALLDLGRALPALGDDIRCQPRRDTHGLVFFHLRGGWGSAGGFVVDMRPQLQALAGPAAVSGAATTQASAQRCLVQRPQAVAAA